MNTLNQDNIAIVRGALKGARLAKFDASIAVLRESLALNSWVPRGNVKSSAGFYQGLVKFRDPEVEVCSTDWYCLTAIDSVLRYGGRLSFMEGFDSPKSADYAGLSSDQRVERAIKVLREAGELKKVSDTVILAWIALNEEAVSIRLRLDAARPAPKVTPIGLSPKVTATLTEMNLDLDLASVKPAKIETRYRDAFLGDGSPKLNADGSRAREPYYFVVWSDGIHHGESRFGSSGRCEACNKHIPSGRFVPVEAKDKSSGKLISLWLGCDCAKNIFGIQDTGVEK